MIFSQKGKKKKNPEKPGEKVSRPRAEVTSQKHGRVRPTAAAYKWQEIEKENTL